MQINSEGDPTWGEWNENPFQIWGNDQALYFGVNTTNHVSYIQSVDIGTGASPLLLNARGGSVGIGLFCIPAGYKLAVKGKILAEEIKVSTSEWCDYVFDKEYDLMPLGQVAEFITTYKHLPDVPSQAEVIEQEGVSLGEMNAILLKKIEELTLYMIEQQEQLSIQREEIEALKEKVNF